MSHSASLAPLFLRLAVGIVFLWAGLGKVLETFPATGEAAAELVKLGVIAPPVTAAPAAPAPQPKVESGTPAPPDAAPPQTPPTPPAPVASDAEHRVLRLYGISLGLINGANPPVGADGKKPGATLPRFLAAGRRPVYLAWACTVTEIGCGLLVLTGLFTRFSAFSLACVMLVAMWLTEIGPAWRAGGFVPARGTFDGAWQTLAFQSVLLCAALALMSLGSGVLGFDRALFPERAKGAGA